MKEKSNAALVAFTRVSEAFDGEAKKAGFNSEDEMQEYMKKEVRKEVRRGQEMKEIIKKLEGGNPTRRQLEIIIDVMGEKYNEFFVQSMTRIAMAGNINAELYICEDEKERERLTAKRDAILQEERERREEYDHASYLLQKVIDERMSGSKCKKFWERRVK